MKKSLSRALTLILALIVHISFAQEKSISGTVTDQFDMPLPGVNIVVVGTTSGTQTDFDGNYTIKASAGQKLLFTYIGQKDITITIGSNNTINVQMEDDAQALDEVVLTALGLEKKKDDDLSSSSIVKVDQLQKSGESGVLQGLSGKTSGVNITRTSGDPGAGAYIQIRGQNTILGDNTPLIVLDGALISNSSTNLNTTQGVSEQSRLNDLNPDDIESITVLKGASAAAVYGTGAANGVLVINTKRAAKGGKKWSVNVKSSVSIDQINREWTKQGTYGQGTPSHWSGIDDWESGQYVTNSGFSFGDKIAQRSGGADEVNTSSSEYFIADDGTTYYPITSKNSQEVFNQSNRDAIFKTGFVFDNSVSFSYSGEESSTFVSLSNWDQDGIYNGASDYKRTTLKLNNDTDFSDQLKFRLSTTYANISSNRVQTGSNVNGLYLGYLRSSPDFDIRDYKGTNYRNGTPSPNSHRSYRRYLGSYRTFDASSGVFSYTVPTYNNPLWTLNEQKNISNVNRFIIAPELNYKVNDNLGLTARYSLDYYQDNRMNLWPAGSARDGSSGLFREDRITESIENYNFFINGNYGLAEKINMNFILGYQLYQNDYKRLTAEETGFTNPDEDFWNVGNATSANSNPEDYILKSRKSGGYAVLNFDLWDQLLLEVTGRAEYVSSIPEAGLIFYPSTSLGWNFTQYLEDSFISFGKLRASYGEVGIEPVPYSTRTVYTTGGIASNWGDGLDASLYGNPLTRSTTRGNPDLKEERIKEYEFGFDTRFLNNALSLSASYYNRRSEDVLLDLPTAPSNGYSQELRNAAEITNKGIEIDLNARIINNGEVTWSVNANFTQNKSKVEDMAGSGYYLLNGFAGTSSGVAEGQPFAVLRGGLYARDDNGDLILNDYGFPVADTEAGYLGDPNPDWRGGLGTSVSWKGLTLSAMLETSQGNDAWNGTRGALTFFGISPETDVETVASQDLVNAAGYVIPAGATFRGREVDYGGGPVAVDADWWTTTGGGFGDVDEEFIEDASWTRLREVSLFYQLPSNFIQKMGLTSVEFGITGRNLFLWTAIDGFDPDNNLTGASKGRGLEYFSNPGTKSYITTLRLSF
ncbi:SusC/RagA family TonB-linked outer membrane protein [Maribacter polysaccharolyticus]|uniref:SusC/RagA family TonB-linked outer membrane protein n=1 Tax=Maribacter polysaccharolyticus TaxID=3020831 RepID=UPI00237FA4AD|nr:SusC/RagA family TonB-linked outer membrane protein [Maribacter polysaccharolyticus]MDE3741571.1 SusC/RagA family TonB-linked outer membrane protein [Maribacter polysaccharolyticus]